MDKKYNYMDFCGKDMKKIFLHMFLNKVAREQMWSGDISVVTMFQIFQLLFVFLLVLPLLKVACSYLDRGEKVLREQ